MKTLIINPDDSASVREETGVDEKGNPTATQWDFADADQVKRHRGMFNADLKAADRAKLDAMTARLEK